MASGGCLCGAIRYRVYGALRGVVNCHCGQCLRNHGNYAAYTSALVDDVEIIEQGELVWYAASTIAKRGFCHTCGSSLFWQPAGKDTISIAAGSFDQPSGLATIKHIYTKDKADFYNIHDNLEQCPEGMSEG